MKLLDLQTVLRKIKSKGYKITPQRRVIVQALVEASRPLSAQQLFQRLRGDLPDTGLDTVYRTLRLLADLGIVNQITCAARQGDLFELAADNHHHHLVCLQCGQILCLEECVFENTARQAAKDRHFTVTGHVFEIYGYCQACRHG